MCASKVVNMVVLENLNYPNLFSRKKLGVKFNFLWIQVCSAFFFFFFVFYFLFSWNHLSLRFRFQIGKPRSFFNIRTSKCQSFEVKRVQITVKSVFLRKKNASSKIRQGKSAPTLRACGRSYWPGFWLRSSHRLRTSFTMRPCDSMSVCNTLIINI